jgi:hypothetical protein
MIRHAVTAILVAILITTGIVVVNQDQAATEAVAAEAPRAGYSEIQKDSVLAKAAHAAEVARAKAAEEAKAKAKAKAAKALAAKKAKEAAAAAEKKRAAERASRSAKPRKVNSVSVPASAAVTLACIRKHESGNNYQRISSTGKFQGAYQLHSGYAPAWAKRYGQGDWAGTPVHKWPPAVQDAVALGLGKDSNWGAWDNHTSYYCPGF